MIIILKHLEVYINFADMSQAESFKVKSKVLENSNNPGIMSEKIAVPLKCFGEFLICS